MKMNSRIDLRVGTRVLDEQNTIINKTEIHICTHIKCFVDKVIVFFFTISTIRLTKTRKSILVITILER